MRFDVHAARDEAVRILQDLIRIDTSNPPGNETKAAEYLKALLEREKIPGEIVALEPSRGNLIARLKGSGRRPPLLLMAHTDVVGVERPRAPATTRAWPRRSPRSCCSWPAARCRSIETSSSSPKRVKKQPRALASTTSSRTTGTRSRPSSR